jgi:hypothetical protein
MLLLSEKYFLGIMLSASQDPNRNKISRSLRFLEMTTQALAAYVISTPSAVLRAGSGRNLSSPLSERQLKVHNF